MERFSNLVIMFAGEVILREELKELRPPQLETHCVVSSCDGSHVPLDLLDSK